VEVGIDDDDNNDDIEDDVQGWASGEFAVPLDVRCGVGRLYHKRSQSSSSEPAGTQRLCVRENTAPSSHGANSTTCNVMKSHIHENVGYAF
jgi:hypothetical protein